MTKTLWMLLVAGTVTLSLDTRADAQSSDGLNGPIYGYQIMTRSECLTFRQQMQAATTVQQRDRLRAEHRERIQQRAASMGVTLPAWPMGQGQGQGWGQGQGGNQGQGKGKGQGQGMGQGMGTGQGMGQGGMGQGSGSSWDPSMCGSMLR